nr:MAG TPA: hypothetical protein [Caudoviricetes sp.]
MPLIRQRASLRFSRFRMLQPVIQLYRFREEKAKKYHRSL